MSFCQKIDTVKKWIPRAALAIVIVFLLLIFWGVVDFCMRFLEVSSYFSIPLINNELSSGAIKERNQKMNDLLKERAQKRQTVSAPADTQNDAQKDPFNLP